MSIPYAALHELASRFTPDGTILGTSCWVAVLVHNISQVDEITKKGDFVWAKCHPNITVRTIKHEYFVRHPLEDLELKFDNVFPKEDTVVKQLRKRSPVKDTNLLVMRAFEPENVEQERQFDQDLKFVEEAVAGSTRQTNGKKVIVLDSPAETPRKEKRKADHMNGERSPETGAPQAARDHDTHMTTEEANEVDDLPFFEIPPPPGYEASDHKPLLVRDEHLSSLSERIYLLPQAAQQAINTTPWTKCGSCTKIMCLKAWTRFNREGAALCTLCTRTKLENADLIAEFKQADNQSKKEFELKQLRLQKGFAQNLDLDAPFDWPVGLNADLHETADESDSSRTPDSSEATRKSHKVTGVNSSTTNGLSMGTPPLPSPARVNTPVSSQQSLQSRDTGMGSAAPPPTTNGAPRSSGSSCTNRNHQIYTPLSSSNAGHTPTTLASQIRPDLASPIDARRMPSTDPPMPTMRHDSPQKDTLQTNLTTNEDDDMLDDDDEWTGFDSPAASPRPSSPTSNAIAAISFNNLSDLTNETFDNDEFFDFTADRDTSTHDASTPSFTKLDFPEADLDWPADLPASGIDPSALMINNHSSAGDTVEHNGTSSDGENDEAEYLEKFADKGEPDGEYQDQSGSDGE